MALSASVRCIRYFLDEACRSGHSAPSSGVDRSCWSWRLHNNGWLNWWLCRSNLYWSRYLSYRNLLLLLNKRLLLHRRLYRYHYLRLWHHLRLNLRHLLLHWLILLASFRFLGFLRLLRTPEAINLRLWKGQKQLTVDFLLWFLLDHLLSFDGCWLNLRLIEFGWRRLL
jgi:hypothetical protein